MGVCHLRRQVHTRAWRFATLSVMRYHILLALLISSVVSPTVSEVRADPYGCGGYEDAQHQGSGDPSRDEELRRERHKTAIARQRAQQAYLDYQTQMYDYQREQQEIYIQRAEQERQYDERSDDITNVNQVANTVASIARQVQILSGGGGGW